MDVVKNRFALEAIATQAREAMICLDAEGRIVSWNPAADNLYGLSRKEAAGKSLAELIMPPDEHARFHAHLNHFTGNGRNFRQNNGRTLKIATRTDAASDLVLGVDADMYVLLIPAQNEILAILTRASGNGISQAARDGSEDQTGLQTETPAWDPRFSEHVLHHAPLLIGSITPEGKIAFVNAALEELTGLSARELFGQSAFKMLAHYTRLNDLRELRKRFLGLGGRLENDALAMRDTAGNHRLIAWSTLPYFDEAERLAEIVVFGRDITADQQMKETLDRLAWQQEALLNNAPGLVWIKDRQGRIVEANDMFAQACEIPRSKLRGKSDHQIWPGEVADLFVQADSAVIESGERLQVEDFRQDTDGSIRCYESIKTPVRNDHGQTIGMVGMAREITDRKRIEETLQGTNDGIWDWNILNDRLYFNDCFLKTLEISGTAYQMTQPTIQTFFDLIHPDDRARVLNQLHAYLADPSCKYKEECRLLKRNGGYCYCVIKGEVMRNKDGRPIRMAGIISDITEQKLMEEALHMAHQDLVAVNEQLSQELSERERLENQLVQAQKMESIGQLAAGIAHEINNPVGFVQSNMSTLQEYVDIFKELMILHGRLADLIPERGLSPEAANLITRIRDISQAENLAYILDDANSLVLECQDGLNRVKEIVHGLKTFARIDESDLKETNINECLESTLKIVWNELKYKCEVYKTFNPLPLISCHPGQLNQVFMNLLVNAAQAIHDKGKIHIRTFAEPGHICIEISDTGAGIEPTNIKNIFNPFFTTKPVGKGTGLGLSISYGIIQKHCGKIEVESEINVGTTFRIVLPLHGGIQPSASLFPTEPGSES